LKSWRPASLALDCSYPPRTDSPRNHNDLTQALSIIDRIKPKRAYLTHVGHAIDAWLEKNEACLPAQVSIVRDNWVVQGSD